MKIAVVCANPWEAFLPPMFQGNAKEFYLWLFEQSKRFNKRLLGLEEIERYGDSIFQKKDKVFEEKVDNLQIFYVQSHQKERLKKILNEADRIVVGMPNIRKECDNVYLSVLPWKEKCIFLWEGTCREVSFFEQIQNDYKLEKKQIVNFKRLSPV